MQDIVSPIFLTATAAVSSGSASGVNSIALKNPLNLPMEILEIRFQTYSLGGDIANNFWGASIACKLDLGKYPLTNGYVPIGAFSKPELLPEPEPVNEGGSINDFVWRLARPLFIPAGTTVTPTFFFRTTSFPGMTMNVRVSLVGRSMAAGYRPPHVYVPYAAAFVSKSMEYNDADSDQSTETDLVNPFDKPLFLQRFGGRLPIFDNTNASIVEDNYPDLMGLQAVNVRMVDSVGRPTIKNFVPFRQAFAGPTRTWEVDGAQLEPGAYYIATIRKDAPVVATANVLSTQAVVSMVGWREET